MIAPTARAAVEEIDFTTMNVLSQNNIVNWRFVYQTINYCNTVIELAPDVLKADPTFTPSTIRQSCGAGIGHSGAYVLLSGSHI
jgi:hypothetical protein